MWQGVPEMTSPRVLLTLVNVSRSLYGLLTGPYVDTVEI